MKLLRIAHIVTLVMVTTVSIFCAGSKPQKKPSVDKQVPASKQIIVEDFDPAALGDYTESVKETKKSGSGPVDIDEILKSGAKSISDSTQKIEGYRVQIVSTRDEEEARTIRTEALLDFDQAVYLTFDDPYYKVRVGDCISRFEADNLQEDATKKGYVEAWVVRTNVFRGALKSSKDGASDPDM